MSALLFPVLPGQTLDVIRAPKWNTSEHKALSGKRTVIGYQFCPRMHFELKYDLLRDSLTPSEIRALVGLFNQLQGGYDTFLFQDPDFNTVVGSPFGVGDGVTTQFQLTAYYCNATTGVGYFEIVQVLNGQATIFLNSIQASAGFSIGSTGVVTFSVPPGLNTLLEWSGSFYYRCAFDDDTIDVNKFMNLWWDGRKIAFTQVVL
jgi:uncharacterized protein (TIGR02217 family)